MAKKKAETVEVVVVTKFKDKENGKKLRKVGEIFEVTKERYEEIAEAGKKAGVKYVEVNQPEDDGEQTDGSEADGDQSDSAEGGE